MGYREVTPEVWAVIMNMAETVHLSRYVRGCGSREQAAFLLLKAYELDFPFGGVSDFFDVMDGKPVLKPKAMLAIVHRNKVHFSILENTDQRCTMYMKRNDSDFEHTITLTIQDAQRAGWIKPNGAWGKIPANMLRWRTLGFLAQIVIPDLLAGMYVSSDFEDVSENEEIED